MASSSRPDPQSDRIQDFVAWIDRALEKDLPPMEVAPVLTEYALPSHRGLVSPFVYGGDGWNWPWNRVGFAYTKRERYLDAASIFSVAYLSALRIQNDYQERIHKGMPLCNVAYCLIRASEPMKARVPAALGLIEDITTFIIPTSTENLSNLSASGYSGSFIQAFIDEVSEAYRSKNRFPLYPEVVLHTTRWGTVADATRSVASLEQIVGNMQQIASRFAPETMESSLAALRRVWQQYSPIASSAFPHGDPVHGRAEPALGVGSGPISGTATISGSNARG
jgi:hypothetical protein